MQHVFLKMSIKLICLILYMMYVAIKAKPFNNSTELEKRIVYEDRNNDKKYIQLTKIEDILGRQNTSQNSSTNVKNHRSFYDQIDENKDDLFIDNIEDSIEDDHGSGVATTNTPNKNTTNVITTVLELFSHKFKLSPQTLFQDRLGLLKQALASFGMVLPDNAFKAKQFLNANGLIHLTGLDNNGFYTNRLQPAGFFGGNGWFANKGGLLGGPGAILSTGSILTDYPTSYRKK